MSGNIDPTLVEDIFNIPRNGQNIAEESDEEDLGLPGPSASVSFDEKVSEVVDTLSKAGDVPSVAKKAEKSEEKTKESKVVEPNNDVETALKRSAPQANPVPVSEKRVSAPAPSPTSTSSNLFDDDDATEPTVSSPKPKAAEPAPQPKVEKSEPVAPKVESKPTPVQARKVVTPLPDNPDDEELANDDTKSADSSGPCEPWKAGEQWLLTSPAPKYDRLYREKKIALTPGVNSILKGGQLDFDKLFDELAELSVDVTVKTYNPQDIHDKMQLVQKLRTRLEHIRLQVSRQYHHWERYIELFHGVLCRTEYERGKQEGLNYDHLRDMEHYFCSLKALHKASEGVMRTLDGAFECLSRQVTVVLPMKEIERYGNSNGNAAATTPSAPKPMTPGLRKMDSLSSQPTNAPKSDSPDGGNGLPSGWAL
jgi:hypothetical protein